MSFQQVGFIPEWTQYTLFITVSKLIYSYHSNKGKYTKSQLDSQGFKLLDDNHTRDCRYGEYCSSSKKCVRQLRGGNGFVLTELSQTAKEFAGYHLPCRHILHFSSFWLMLKPRYGVGGSGRPSVAFGDGQVIKRSSLFTSIALRINARESILKVVIDVQGESEPG